MTAEVGERFESDTAEHELTVLRDEGLYRHLSYGKPRSGTMRVDVVTWPGHLAYVGDMGAFVFSRVADMFTFFRGDRRKRCRPPILTRFASGVRSCSSSALARASLS
jgi:hypothetical protein